MSDPRGNPLLDPVDQLAAEQYYEALLSNLAVSPGLEVRVDAGGSRGKGLFATKDYKQGDVIFTERPLVGIQELHSKLDTATCAYCFTAVGTVEQAFGGKICCLINELSDATEDDDLQEIQNKVDKIQAAVDSKRLEGLLSGKVQLPLADKVELCTTPVLCRGGCDDEYCSKECEQHAWQHHHCLLCPGSTQQQQQQQGSRSCKHSGAGSSSSSSSSSRSTTTTEQLHGVTLNRTKLGSFLEHADDTNDIFRVAAQVIANTIITADKLLQQAAADAAEAAEAAAAYSTAAAAAAAGKRASQRVLAAAGPAAAAAAAASSSAQLAAAVPDEAAEQQQSAAAFEAATAAAQSASGQQHVLAHADAAAATAATSAEGSGQQQQQQQQHSKEACLAALKAAFLPYAMGHKAPWWNVAQAAEEAAAAAAAGDESGSEDDGSSSDSSSRIDPAELAAQVQELSAESLALLRAGLQDQRFPELFNLQLYGSLVGMFEYNNLALTVPGPVGRYKAMLGEPQAHGIAPAEAAAALQEVSPLLEALGDTADEPAEGTGFFALQSTMNHSCAPNAAADCLASGQVVISALKDIPAGAEVMLSYIEGEEEADLRERQLRLRDYGFDCCCERCQADQLAAGLQAQQL